MRIKIFFCYFFLWTSLLFSKSAIIIIHGTWAQNETWYKQQGDFFKVVKRSSLELEIDSEVISFAWSGKLSYECQLQAAKQLVEIIVKYDHVILIGHSHGATVGILASQILGGAQLPDYKISEFYALGVPVDPTEKIYPDMSVIQFFYNLFSFGDFVQPVNLAYERCFAAHDRLGNIAILLNDLHPSHSQLHHPDIGKDILKINFFVQKKLGNFENFKHNEPGQISFYQYALPKYEIQHNQKELLELDKKVHWLATMAFFRKPKKLL